MNHCLIGLSSHLKESDSPDSRGGKHLGEHIGAAQQDDGGGRDHDKIYSGNPILNSTASDALAVRNLLVC